MQKEKKNFSGYKIQSPNYACTKIYMWKLFCNAFLNKHLTNNGVLTVYTQMC